MKKLIFILALGIISCSTPEQETTSTDDCVCYKVYYQSTPYYQGGAWTWVYEEQSKELFSTGGTCQETGYIRITGGNFYKIECR